MPPSIEIKYSTKNLLTQKHSFSITFLQIEMGKGDDMTSSQASFCVYAPSSIRLSCGEQGRKICQVHNPLVRWDSIDSTCHLSRAHSNRVMCTGREGGESWNVTMYAYKIARCLNQNEPKSSYVFEISFSRSSKIIPLRTCLSDTFAHCISYQYLRLTRAHFITQRQAQIQM